MANFKFDRETFEDAIQSDVREKNVLLMDDLSKIKMCVERALEVCLDSTANRSMSEFRSVGI